ncbi:stealth conserved region 3 domain-containing protein [Microterricola viridarii]|uniref:Stealth protein CR1, conserved region 1 n=1 Tax=Microterricola viridarii TaxID=412690 RepID=A0A1H1YB12_9MICO|nr:stealth conserved region 3 domain-containing protein [Microterricola viridarii]SDT18196.1 Stealth protein CR1, conserved region 1 [Microterricola viridarii]
MTDRPRDTETLHPLGDQSKPAAFARSDDARALAPERERHGFLSAEPEPVLRRQTEPTVPLGGGTPPRFARTDLVLRRGEYTLTSGHFTPQESMVDDLLAVRAALIDAGIDFLLVRGDNDRPVIAVDRRQRRALSRALAEAFRDEPFYSATLDRPGKPSVLLADGVLSPARKAAVFRLYRPRVEPIGRLRYGPETAFQLELWRFGDDEIVAPRENALMRARMPRHEAVEDTVELYGRRWRTLEHMFAELASDVSFDIDMVFSWVDGSDAAFQRARAARMAGYVVGDGDDSDARFRQIDELKYALRSVYLFAPWVRRIFIATDSPVPAWLGEHPRVTVVRSEEFFQNPDALPTHNSHAVESQLHHIPGIAKHFLYSNDDMFFGRPLSPELFFSPGGVTKFVEAGTRIGLGESNPSRSGFENAARVNRRLLKQRFGKVTTRHLEHCAAPLRTDVLETMEREFAEDFARTAASQFRSATDISVTNSFYHYYALMTGHAVTQTLARVKYIETTLRSALPAMDKLVKRRDQDMFCLNDGSKPEISNETRTAAVTEFLEKYFPFPAPWERDAERPADTDAEAGAASAQP